MRYFVLAGLIAGAILGYYVLWSHLVDRVAAEAAGWMERQRALGREVGHGGQRLWGFPYRLSITLTRPYWHDPKHPAGWRVDADEITAHLQLWDIHHVIFDLPGSQRLAWREVGVRQEATLASERMRASLVLDGAGNWLRVATDVAAPRLTGALQDWSAGKLLVHARRTGTLPPEADLAVQADGLVLPPAAEGPLGRSVAQLKLIGSLRGTVRGTTPDEMLAEWRDSGGVLDLQTIALAWGELRIDGSGTLSLDRQFRPLGAMSGQIRGVAAGIDALVASGRMKPTEAGPAKALLAVIAQKDEKGESYLPVPLSAQDGRLFLGPVALFSLPSVLPGQPVLPGQAAPAAR